VIVRYRCLVSQSFGIILLGALFFVGCAASKTYTIPDLTTLTPEDIQQKVARNFEKLYTFQGSARIILSAPGAGHRGTSKVYINFPDSVYVKMEAILGIDVGVLFFDHNYFAAYAPREKTLYYGHIDALHLRDFIEIDIEPDELLEVFTGLTQVVLNENSQMTLKKGKILITTSFDVGKSLYLIDPQKYVVERNELMNKNGEVILTKEYSRFRKRGDIHLPQTIKLTRPIAKERITVYYNSQKINKKIPPEKFKMKVAKNVTKVYRGDRDKFTF